jgi:hypothetical protein
MLEEIAAGRPQLAHAAAWEARMRRWAARCERVLLLSPDQIERAGALLDLPPERCVVSPNGFDPQTSSRRGRSTARPTGATTSSSSRAAGDRARRGVRALLRGRGRRPVPRAGRSGGRPLHGREAHRPPDPRVRARPRAGSTARPRSCSWAASRASGRTSTPTTRSATTRRAPRPPGRLARPRRAAPTSSAPPTSRPWPPCASSSARSSWRAWPAACRPSPSIRHGPAHIVDPAAPGGSSSPTTRRACAAALVAALRTAPSAGVRGAEARASRARALVVAGDRRGLAGVLADVAASR